MNATPKKRLTAKEEAALVDRAQAGDEAALAQLLDHSYLPMYRLALKYSGDPDIAADATQEACVMAIRRLHQFRGASRFSSWVGRIVINAVRMSYRSSSRYVPTEETIGNDQLSREPRPDDAVADAQLVDLIDDFLSRQRDGDHDLFVRRYVNGDSLSAICESTGITMPALKSRLHRARNRLKERSERARWGVEVFA